MGRTCLVVACWSGRRRQASPAYEADRGYLLRRQTEALSSLRHSLTAVYLVVPHDASTPPEFSDALSGFPKRFGTTAVHVISRENSGLSYGSWDAVMASTWGQYDHHILIEDDYVFTEDHFDRDFVAWHDSIPDCGYLCGLVQQVGTTRFAGVSNGILRSCHYRDVANAHGGRMPFIAGQRPDVKSQAYLGEGGQVAFGSAWECCGKRLYDMTAFCSVSWYMNGFVRCVPHPQGRMPLAPVQLLELREAGLPEDHCRGEPGVERTVLPYPPPPWAYERLLSRS